MVSSEKYVVSVICMQKTATTTTISGGMKIFLKVAKKA
jgi:hypothetical protein